MRDNPYAEPKKRVGLAVRHLMSPVAPFERRLAEAMAELARGVRGVTLSRDAATHYGNITAVMGEAPWDDRTRTLSDAERTALVAAFWSLDRVLARDYFAWSPDAPAEEPR